uniref:AAA-type ATPase N-terminal domain-containing protein n=1 Tax=Nelumbo nucifera TaxID=4432 RepID=A0A822XLR1_NELNU|nr:TPA_asm: hypothetical protein HUJ06_021339 [Nelumbo nucifera]
MLSAYASLTASTMLIRLVANEFIPHQIQDYIFSGLRYLFSPRPSQLMLIFEEFSGITRNQVYEAAELYHEDHPLDRTSKGVQGPQRKEPCHHNKERQRGRGCLRRSSAQMEIRLL